MVSLGAENVDNRLHKEALLENTDTTPNHHALLLQFRYHQALMLHFRLLNKVLCSGFFCFFPLVVQ